MNKTQNHFEMKQEEVAEALGVNSTTLNYYEREALKIFKKALEEKRYKASDFLEMR